MSDMLELARFDHHPDPAIDFCIEVEELENIAISARLGLTGYGHEADIAALDHRIELAMGFMVGADANCVSAKGALRELATGRGFIVTGEIGYAGQRLPRARAAGGGLAMLAPFIRQHRPGHMQFINPTPWTRRSLRAPQVIAQRKAERARDGDE